MDFRFNKGFRYFGTFNVSHTFFDFFMNNIYSANAYFSNYLLIYLTILPTRSRQSN